MFSLIVLLVNIQQYQGERELALSRWCITWLTRQGRSSGISVSRFQLSDPIRTEWPCPDLLFIMKIYRAWHLALYCFGQSVFVFYPIDMKFRICALKICMDFNFSVNYSFVTFYEECGSCQVLNMTRIWCIGIVQIYKQFSYNLTMITW